MKLTFWGAAQTVTGSMHELTHHGERYLLDCGLYQGRRKEAFARNSTFPFAPSSVKSVLLSHAHTDHAGNLPTLVKNGFTGPIWANAATTDLCQAMLRDSAYLQERDAEFIARRNAKRRRLEIDDQDLEIVAPLYGIKDAEQALEQFQVLESANAVHEVAEGLLCQRFDAGHMLGSTAMVLEAKEGGKRTRLAFSGDVGRVGLPIIRDPEALPAVDYLIMESTYGNRLHEHNEAVEDKLEAVIKRTVERGGKVIVPAFAVGRTQQVVLMLHGLMKQGRLPAIPIFVDSPLAVNVTEVFRRHPECFDEHIAEYLQRGEDPFGFSRLKYVREVADSKALNDLRGPVVIISASGMCEGGRVLHHLRNNIGDPRNTVLITGYQGENTLGRKIVDKAPEVNIFGEPFRLRAEVVKLNELSGHADQRELLSWMKPMVGSLKRVFLVHGELLPANTLAKLIEEEYHLPVTVAARGESFSLD
ncbi:MAG: MBL fold metallo-hydrolase [Bryobacteraceae bacterium]|nr:MBL fold metallo-hydrolase [Bryobacteraceae bacterium]